MKTGWQLLYISFLKYPNFINEPLTYLAFEKIFYFWETLIFYCFQTNEVRWFVIFNEDNQREKNKKYQRLWISYEMFFDI